MTNERIFKEGTIVGARKIEVITIGLGLVKDLKEVEEVIRHEDGKTIITTKEAPQGCEYEADRTVVVRIIDGKVKIDDKYDIYAPADDKIERLLSRPFDMETTLSKENLDELRPVLDAASEIRPSIAPEEKGRRVIVITEEMIESGITTCYNEWDPETPCDLYAGDVFLVSDESCFKGYRIGKEEFAGTHALD